MKRKLPKQEPKENQPKNGGRGLWKKAQLQVLPNQNGVFFCKSVLGWLCFSLCKLQTDFSTAQAVNHRHVHRRRWRTGPLFKNKTGTTKSAPICGFGALFLTTPMNAGINWTKAHRFWDWELNFLDTSRNIAFLKKREKKGAPNFGFCAFFYYSQ